METNQPTAPVSTGSTPTTPAVSAVAERPTSFSQAIERVEAAETAAPATESPATTDPASADATAPPATPDVENAPPVETQGPIPFARHKQALDNARKEAAAEAEKAFSEKHRNHIEWGQAIEQNPVNALHLVKDVLRDPTYGPQMRAELGRMFGGLRQPTPKTEPASDPEPPRWADGPNGELLYDPKVDATWQEWKERQLLNKVEQKFQPLVKDHETRQQYQKLERLWQDSNAEMKAVFDDYAEMPGFKTAEGKVHPEIIKVFKELTEPDGRGVPRTEPKRALFIAYQKVLKAEVIPGAEKKSQQDLMATAAAKSAGRTDNPAAATPAPPKRPRSAAEALQQQGLM